MSSAQHAWGAPAAPGSLIALAGLTPRIPRPLVLELHLSSVCAPSPCLSRLLGAARLWGLPRKEEEEEEEEEAAAAVGAQLCQGWHCHLQSQFPSRAGGCSRT